MTTVVETGVGVPIGHATLEGDLAIPEAAPAVVLFAHGSGSSRQSPRDRFVAERLQEAGFGTFLLDLLTSEEEGFDRVTGELRSDITLLARRLIIAVDWLRVGAGQGLATGVFGAGTGASAALSAAAERRTQIGAIVSRDGRPDLAHDALPRVEGATLLIVGALDRVVLELNEVALELIPAEKQLAVVPGASHALEERGALEEVALLAVHWFSRHLGDRAA